MEVVNVDVQTNLRDREACQFHELVEGKGPRAHKLTVESSSSLCRKGLGPPFD